MMPPEDKNYRQDLKVRPISVTDQVADKIKEIILSGDWAEDEKIPSEAELAAMFGVNRITVRMALQKMNTLGILQTRPGEGTYVRHFSLREYIQEASEFYMRPEILDDVCEFRKVVEVECAVLAMQRATEEEFDELKRRGEFYARLAAESEGKDSVDDELFNRLVHADVDFHYQICKMAHNYLFRYSYTVARESIYQYMRMIVRKRIDSNYAIHSMHFVHSNMHMELYEAIREKDEKKCRELYLAMIDYNVDLNEARPRLATRWDAQKTGG